MFTKARATLAILSFCLISSSSALALSSSENDPQTADMSFTSVRRPPVRRQPRCGSFCFPDYLRPIVKAFCQFKNRRRDQKRRCEVQQCQQRNTRTGWKCSLASPSPSPSPTPSPTPSTSPTPSISISPSPTPGPITGRPGFCGTGELVLSTNRLNNINRFIVYRMGFENRNPSFQIRTCIIQERNLRNDGTPFTAAQWAAAAEAQGCEFCTVNSLANVCQSTCSSPQAGIEPCIVPGFEETLDTC